MSVQDQYLQILLQEVRMLGAQVSKISDKLATLEEMTQRVLVNTTRRDEPQVPLQPLPQTQPQARPVAFPPTFPVAQPTMPQQPPQAVVAPPPVARPPIVAPVVQPVVAPPPQTRQQIQFDERLIADACKLGYGRDQVVNALYQLYFRQKPCNDLNVLIDELNKTATQAPAPIAQGKPMIQFDERLITDGCRLGHTREQVVKTLNEMYSRGLPCNDLNVLLDELMKSNK